MSAPQQSVTAAFQTRFNLYKCIYDEAGSRSLCQQFVDRLPEAFRARRAASKPGVNEYQEMMELVHEAVRLFDTLAPLIKHSDFVAEAEWRLVSDPVDLTKRPIRLREEKTGIVPHIELTIAKDETDPRFTVHTLVGPSIRHNPRIRTWLRSLTVTISLPSRSLLNPLALHIDTSDIRWFYIRAHQRT